MAAVDIKTLAELSEKLERLRSENERAKGALSAQLKILNKEWGVKTLKQAKSKLKEMQREVEKAKDEFQKEFDAFLANNADVLNELGGSR